MIKKNILLLIPLAAVLLFTGKSYAAANYNDVIDDVIFDNTSTMNAGQIDAFLNTFPNSCISTNSGFTAPDPTGYNPTSKFTYGSDVSAGTVIYDAAQAYGINPQVILATLEKEQGLVVGDGANIVRNGTDCGALAISASMGYNCPDTLVLTSYSGFELYAHNGVPVTSVSNTCVRNASYVGFSRQVIVAAWQLTFDRHRSEGQNNWYINKPNWDNSDDLGFCYSGYDAAGGPYYLCPDQNSHANDPYVSHSGQYVIDGSTVVTMTNGSTAALYNYTPHLHGQDLFTANFSTWFGSPNAVKTSWQDVGQAVYTDSARTKPANTDILSPSTTYYITVSAKNMGSVTWTQGILNLGTSNPTNRTSIFCNSSWLDYGAACNRAATISQSSVAPGSVGTFLFSITTPSGYGTYKEYFRPVAEGQTWLDDVGMYFQFSVRPPTYAWAPVSQQLAVDNAQTMPLDGGVLAPNTTYYLQLKALNTGNTTWTNTGSNPVRLGTTWPTDRMSTMCTNAWTSCNRPASLTEASVAPGEVGTFSFPITTPSTYGTYREYFNVLAEGTAWTRDVGLYWQITTRVPTAVWQYQGQSFYTDSTKSTAFNPSQISNGTRFYTVVSARNIGNTTWTNTGSNPVRLGTTWPTDRMSTFCDASWITCNRPAALDQASVAPGQTGTFSFWMDAPYATNGTAYREYFAPVMEGAMWMNDIGLYVPTTMQSPLTAWQYQGQSAYADSGHTTPVDLTTASTNTTYYLELKAKNTSGATWYNSSPTPLRIGVPNNQSSPFCNNTWIGSGCNRPAALKESSITPGQIGTFDFSITTPASATTTNFYLRPVVDGQNWLDDVGLYWPITTH